MENKIMENVDFIKIGSNNIPKEDIEIMNKVLIEIFSGTLNHYVKEIKESFNNFPIEKEKLEDDLRTWEEEEYY